MNEKQFEELWVKAEAGSHAEKLAAEYPVWRQKTRRTLSMAAGVALVLAVATPIALSPSATGNYNKVYCNRAGIQDQQWVNLAEELLMEG